jgi:hypothetical protein
METIQRNSQTIAGEMLPRHFYVGKESCRRLGAMINAFREEGLNLHAIPLINEVEQGILAEDLDPGTVIGCRTPISETDEPGVIVWDGYGLSAISFMSFHRKQETGWIFNNNSQSEVVGMIDPTTSEQKKRKKSKKTTPRHKEQKQRKARNGRRV